MTADKPTIDHSCSYHCDRPECIKAQRDEMRERLKQIEAQEPVGIVGAGPRAGGFTMATFEAEKVPVGTNLYTKPEANEQPKDSQPVPVEPDAIVRWRFIKEKTGGLEPRLVYVLDYIDTLQSELKRVTEERDSWKTLSPCELMAGNPALMEYGKHWEGRAEAAESLNKRMVELLRPLGKIADTNGGGWSEDEVNSMARGIKAMSAELLKEVEK